MKKYLSFMPLFLFVTCPIFALDLPNKSNYDTRMRFTSYNPQDVVQLDTMIGVATHIIFEEDEQYLTHAFGDSAAYSFAVEKNHVFIKPKAENADTNLIIVTDRRSYSFRLKFHNSGDASAVYQLAFRYPDTVSKKRQQLAEQSTIDREFKGQHGIYNLSYSMSGDTDIGPINAWDNNEFTFFKFPGNRDIPGIYMVDADGKESIVNRNSVGYSKGVIKVHKVNAKWVLRIGNRALAVFNESYDPNGVENSSRTASPAVRRVIKRG
jgi:type IV secretion system protein VirB9